MAALKRQGTRRYPGESRDLNALRGVLDRSGIPAFAGMTMISGMSVAIRPWILDAAPRIAMTISAVIASPATAGRSNPDWLLHAAPAHGRDRAATMPDR